MSPSRLRAAEAWDHNNHYHPLVLQAVSEGCGRALDVGCGRGSLARKLTERCREVVAIDADRGTLAHAAADGSGVHFIEGDAMTYGFEAESFDFITAVATLHHLPLTAALARLRELLKPGGTLAVIGLYRLQSPLDYLFAAVAHPVSWLYRRGRPHAKPGAPMTRPETTLKSIREACEAVLPGAILKRRLFFRYSLIWRKPQLELM